MQIDSLTSRVAESLICSSFWAFERNILSRRDATVRRQSCSNWSKSSSVDTSSSKRELKTCGHYRCIKLLPDCNYTLIVNCDVAASGTLKRHLVKYLECSKQFMSQVKLRENVNATTNSSNVNELLQNGYLVHVNIKFPKSQTSKEVNKVSKNVPFMTSLTDDFKNFMF